MSKKHIHKYEKVPFGSQIGTSKKVTSIHKCMIPGCDHYKFPWLYGNSTSRCWGCDEIITIGAENKHLVKPMCEGCREERKERLAKLASVT